MHTIPNQIQRLQTPALIAGLAAAGLGVAGIFISGPARFFQSYLFAYMFWLGLTGGSLAFAMLYYLVGGGWGRVVQRSVEAAGRVMPLMALLFIPILFGIPYLYAWSHPEIVAESAALQHKAGYLNVPFFIGRAVFYFLVWIAFGFVLYRWGRNPRYAASTEARRNLQRLAAFGLIAYFLTMTFAAFDWMMSLQPDWYSTIYGFLVLGMQAVAALAFAILLLPLLARYTAISALITARHYRDLGALLLTAVTFWAYLAFSQLLIIWSGNLPHEASWYLARSTGGWTWVGVFVFAIQFGLPFLVLLSLRAKRSPTALVVLSLGILFANLVDYFWHVIPAFYPGQFTLSWLDLVMPVAVGGLWLYGFIFMLRRIPVLGVFHDQAAHSVETEGKLHSEVVEGRG